MRRANPDAIVFMGLAHDNFHPYTRMLNRHPDDHAPQMQNVVTNQHLGVREGWTCSACRR